MREGKINKQIVFLFISIFILLLSCIIILILRNTPKVEAPVVSFPVSSPKQEYTPVSYTRVEIPQESNSFQVSQNKVIGSYNPVANIQIISNENFTKSSTSQNGLVIESKNFKLGFSIPFDGGGAPNTLEYQRVGTFNSKPLYKLITDLTQYLADPQLIVPDGYTSNTYGTNSSPSCDLPIGTISTECRAPSLSIPFVNLSQEGVLNVSCGVKDLSLMSECTKIIENMKVELIATAPQGYFPSPNN